MFNNGSAVNDRWKVWGYNWDRCCHDMCLAVSCMHYLLPCCVCHVHVCEYRVSVCVCACERITVSPAAWYRQHAVPSTPHSPAQLSASADRHPSATVASCRFALPQTLTVLDQMHFLMLSLNVCLFLWNSQYDSCK